MSFEITTVYIISYRPANADNPEHEDFFKWKKREAFHKYQLNCLVKQGWNVVINAQNYKNQLPLKKSDQITYLWDDGIGIVRARNNLLARFYESSQDWGVFLDDDSWFYNKPQHVDAFNLPRIWAHLNPEHVASVGAINATMPHHCPFTKFVKDHELELKHRVLLERTGCLIGGHMLVRNFQKCSKTGPIYIDEMCVNGEFIPGEDNLFGMKIVQNGFGVYKCWNWMQKTLSTNESTWRSALPNTELVKKMEDRLEFLCGASRREVFKQDNFLKKMSIPKNGLGQVESYDLTSGFTKLTYIGECEKPKPKKTLKIKPINNNWFEILKKPIPIIGKAGSKRSQLAPVDEGEFIKILTK